MRSGRLPVKVFTIGYLLYALGFAMFKNNQEFLLYGGVVLLIGFVVLWIDDTASFTHGMLWCLSVWGLLHMLGGLVVVPETWLIGEGEKHVLYSLWLIPGVLKYDQFVHAYGFGVCMWIAYQWARAVYPVVPRFGILVLCALASLGLGALNEVIEFAATRFIHDTNVGGYDNTLWDLIFNLIGVVVAGTIIRFGEPVHQKTSDSFDRMRQRFHNKRLRSAHTERSREIN